MTGTYSMSAKANVILERRRFRRRFAFGQRLLHSKAPARPARRNRQSDGRSKGAGLRLERIAPTPASRATGRKPGRLYAFMTDCTP